jgi:predicted DNA-binding transcriptional regulator AlpA
MSAQLGLPQRFLRAKEAAVYIGLSTRTLEKHRTHGTGPKYSKVGGRVLYAVSDLTAWAERGARCSTSDPPIVLPAKPVDNVRRVKQIPENAIIVEVASATPVMMSAAEAARFLGLSVQTLAKHRTYGTGPKYRKVGRRILYATTDLTEWAERGAKRSTSDAQTVPPAKPVDNVRRAKQAPENAIIVEVEAIEPAKQAGEADLVELASDIAITVEIESAEHAKPTDKVNLIKPAPDSTIALEVGAAAVSKQRTPAAARPSHRRAARPRAVASIAPSRNASCPSSRRGLRRPAPITAGSWRSVSAGATRRLQTRRGSFRLRRDGLLARHRDIRRPT